VVWSDPTKIPFALPGGVLAKMVQQLPPDGLDRHFAQVDRAARRE
jgi:hypothetical protein